MPGDATVPWKADCRDKVMHDGKERLLTYREEGERKRVMTSSETEKCRHLALTAFRTICCQPERTVKYCRLPDDNESVEVRTILTLTWTSVMTDHTFAH